MTLTALQNQLFQEFKRLWQVMWDTHPDGVTPDTMKATRQEIRQKVLPLAATQSAAMPEAIQELAKIESYGHGYELAMTLLPLIGELDPSGNQYLQLFKDVGTPWFVRRDAAAQLAHFATPEVQDALRQVLLDPSSTGEVRAAAMKALAEQRDPQLLPHLKTLNPEAGAFWYGGDMQILQTRGQLGDFTAARPLMELRNDPWSHRAGAAEQGLASLEADAGGAEGLAATLFEPAALSERSALRQVALHDESPAVRRWAVDRLSRLVPEETVDLWLNALGSDDWNERRSASASLVAMAHPPIEALRAQVTEPLFTDQQRGWAALTLLQLGQDVDFSSLSEPKVPLPPQVTPEIREAIVRYWATSPQYAQQGTDVRWLLEGFEQGMGDEGWEERRAALQTSIQLLIQAWKDAGLTVGEFVTAGEHHQQGDGTYFTGTVSDCQVALSELGPFATCWQEQDPGSAEQVIKQVLREQDWQVLDEVTLQTVVTGLPVYFFGSREPLPVRDLLFYWQD